MTPPPGGVGKGATYGLAVLFGLNLVEEMDRDGFALLIPEIRDAFGMSDAGILSLVAVAALVGLALQVPIAQLADRTHRVRLLLVGAAVFALFSAGTGLVVTAWMLCIARAGGGVGMATAGPTHNSLLSDWFPVADRPRVFSTYRVANAVGAFVGPIMAGALAAWLGWRAPFLVLAVPTVVLIVLAVRLVEPVRGIQERAAMGAEGDLLLTEEPPPSFAESWRMVAKIGSLRRIFHALPFLAAALVGFGSLGALLYERRFGLDELQRSWIAAGAEPAQLVGLFLGARLAGRLIVDDPGRVLRLVAGAAFACAGFATVFALAPWLWLAVAANVAIGTTLAIIGPGIFAGLSLAIPPRARSMGFSVGALWVIPGLVVLPTIGLLSDAVGIRAGMLVLLPVFVVGGLVVASGAGQLPIDIRQVWTQATARSEYLHDRRAGRAPLLLCRDLDVAHGHVQVLFGVGVDVEVDEGEIVALLGTNGAGKSTLLDAICGVVEADRGAVVFDGRDITHTPPEEIALLGIAQMPGGRGVFPSLTVGENLRLAGRRHAGGDDVVERFPVLRERWDEPAGNLSGGQQQMLALAMAFLARPRLLLIDELALGLAPAVVEDLLPVLQDLRERGTSVVLVEQSVELALRVADRAYVLEKGQIRFDGPTTDLLDRPDLLHAAFLPPAPTPADGAAPRVGPGGRGADRDADGVQVGGPRGFSGAAEGRVSSGGAGRVAPGEEGVPVPVGGSAGAGGGPALEVRDLRVRFGGIPAVAGVSLAVAPGEVVGIVGPNGTGKTTLFDLVSGVVPADGGRVLLDGRDLGRVRADVRARAGLGRSFQDARLFPALSVEETLAVALHRWIPVRDPFNPALHLPVAYDAELDVARRVDELVGLLGLGPLRTKLVRELSTGSRRVVDLACVVAHRPRVVLLDEPSSGIARPEVEGLATLLCRLRDELGCCLLVVEHDIPLVSSIADRLVALDQGRIIATGPPPDVLQDPMVLATHLGAQPRRGARMTSDPHPAHGTAPDGDEPTPAADVPKADTPAPARPRATDSQPPAADAHRNDRAEGETATPDADDGVPSDRHGARPASGNGDGPASTGNRDTGTPGADAQRSRRTQPPSPGAAPAADDRAEGESAAPDGVRGVPSDRHGPRSVSAGARDTGTPGADAQRSRRTQPPSPGAAPAADDRAEGESAVPDGERGVSVDGHSAGSKSGDGARSVSTGTDGSVRGDGGGGGTARGDRGVLGDRRGTGPASGGGLASTGAEGDGSVSGGGDGGGTARGGSAGSFGRRYGPVVAIGMVLVGMCAVVAVGNGERVGDGGVAAGAGAGGGGFAPRGVVSWGQAEAAGTTGAIEWGERCDTERGVLAYPARHPPECYAPFAGDNGGATTQGVTADEVTVVLYQPQEHDPILDHIAGAVGSDDGNAAVARTLRDWQAFYETYFETYGRDVRLVTSTATGTAVDDVAARADATQIAERHHPFAVIGGPVLSPAFGDALVSREIVCIDCMPDQRNPYIEAHAPYVVSWHIGPDQADRHVAEFVGTQLKGRDAVHAGDPALRRTQRSFGIVYLSDGQGDDDLAPLEAALADRGVTLDAAVAYASPVDLQRDAPAVIARLRAAGVTSVLFTGDPIAPATLTRAATAQDWFPEWVVAGSGYTDSTLFARTYDQRQWAHAFGVTFLPARVDPRSDSATDLYRWFHGHAPPAASAGLAVLDLELLYSALQGAGPDLTPATFEQALFAAPPTPAGDAIFPVLSWGDHGFWPFVDRGGIDDATVVWWNPAARGPDETGDEGTGMYEYVDGGRRYLPGAWPATPLPLFEPDGAVALYERPPGPEATEAPEAPARPAPGRQG